MHKTKLNISNELVTQFTDYIIQYKKEAKDYYKKLTDYNDKNYTLTLLSIFRDAVNSQNRFIDKVNRFIEKYSVYFAKLESILNKKISSQRKEDILKEMKEIKEIIFQNL